MMEIKKFEKTIDLFVEQNSIEPADAILVKKMPWKLVKHYIIYLGVNKGFHVFMANTLTGVKIYSYDELLNDLKTFIPEKIEKFIGTLEERKDAVHRALTRVNENSYNLILNNCEHFKNWVQNGVHKSPQVENVSLATFGVGGAIAISSKSKGGLYAGLGLMLLGGLAWIFSDDEENIPNLKDLPKRKLIIESTNR